MKNLDITDRAVRIDCKFQGDTALDLCGFRLLRIYEMLTHPSGEIICISSHKRRLDFHELERDRVIILLHGRSRTPDYRNGIIGNLHRSLQL